MRRFRATCAIALLAAPIAHADPGSETDARREFERGLELADHGAYADALAAFEKAHELSRSYRILFNVGKIDVALGRSAEALAAFREYLRSGGPEIDGTRRAWVDAEVARLVAGLGKLLARTEPPGATIRVDGVTAATGPDDGSLELAPGAHDVEATLEGFAPQRTRLVVAAGEQREILLRLEPIAPRATLSTVTPRGEPSAARERWAWIVGGTGVALLTASAVVWVWNDARWRSWRDDRSALDDAWRAAPAADPMLAARQAASDDRLASIKTWDRASLGVGITGAVLGASGLALALTAPKPTAPTMALVPHAGGGGVECMYVW